MRKLTGVLFALGLASVAPGGAVILQNDGFVDGAIVAFQNGFAEDEIGAVTLGPPELAYIVRDIHLLWGPSGPNQQVIVNVWRDTGVTTPGTLIHSEFYDFPASSNQFVLVNLVALNLRVPQGTGIRVGIELVHSGAPSIGGDDDGTWTAERNWIYVSGFWFSAEFFGVERDWIIRATILEILLEDGFENEDFSGWSSTVP